MNSKLPNLIDLKGKKVLLVGGAGFIGHHLAIELKHRGIHVEIIDGLQVNNLLSFTSESEYPNRDLYLKFINTRLKLLRDEGIPIHVIDARDFASLQDAMKSIRPNILIQFAAISHAGKSNKKPFECFDHSLRTLENALETSRDIIEHFIFFSSSMVYGNFNNMAVTEETPCNPIGIYGSLKFAGEKLVIAYNQVFDIPYTIIRPSALYGPRCVSRRVGQIFIESALLGKEIFIDGDGSDRLDFTYIKDLVNGTIRVMEDTNSRGHVLNLTYGESRSIEQMANIIKEHFSNVKITYKPKDKLTPDRGTLSVEKAKKILKYTPEYPLERGFVEYINWYKKEFKQ